MTTKQTDNKESLKAERANAQQSLRELQQEYDGIEGRIAQQARTDAMEKTKAAREGRSPAAVGDRAPDLRARRDELPYLIDAAQVRHAAAVVAVMEVEEQESLEEVDERRKEREELDEQVEPLLEKRNRARADEMGARQRRQQAKTELQRAQRRLREAEQA